MEKNIDLEKIARGVRLMLEGMGENPMRDGLAKTPERVAEFYVDRAEAKKVKSASSSATPSSGTVEA